MDCSTLVDILATDNALVSMLPNDQTGHVAIYQILSPQAELFPRLSVFETGRKHTAWADDAPTLEHTAYRIDIYARENVLRGVNAALHHCLNGNGFHRLAQIADDYLPDEAIYVKSVHYEYDESLEE